ncbi:oligosaccharide flippase family protein [Sphingomonas aerophila]|nr:oligosaccharide flippase family protein [Sphingomonas aerophila]
MLARVLSIEEFGRLALALALFNITTLIAPVGIDQAVLRHPIDPGPRLLLFLLGTATMAALAVAAGSLTAGGLRLDEATALAVAIIAGSIVMQVAAVLRAAQQPFRSIAYATVLSWSILLVGAGALLVPVRHSSTVLWLLAIVNLASAAMGCHLLLTRHRVPEKHRVAIDWREAVSLLGIAAVSTISIQLERLVTPIVLDLRALATFSVLASVAIFPFRLVTAGAGFALTPRLKAATNHRERWALVRTELRIVIPFLTIMSAGIIVAAPWLVRLLTRGLYDITVPLVVAACINGSVKVVFAIIRAVLTGCGTAKQLSHLNLLNIAGLIASIAGAAIGGRYGLVGILLGVSVGNLLAVMPAFRLARQSLRRSVYQGRPNTHVC